MKTTKTTVINSLQNRLDIPKAQASEILETFFETMKKTLSSGEDILISGFGKFSVKEKTSRKGRNPQTGEDLFLDARRVVLFRPSTVIRKRMNSGGKK